MPKKGVKKKILIIGAGPGGLTAGMLLAHRGFDVEIFEKDNQVGGRNKHIDLKGFRFDTGPTFLMMKFILDQVFKESGRRSSDYLKFTKLDPMYRLYFKDKTVDVTDDLKKMKAMIAENFPGDEEGYDRFMKKEKTRYERMYPCLQKSYDQFKTFFHPDFIRALPYFQLSKSMFQALGKYYRDEELKISFTFQSKYLGMSPWSCPAAFLIIPYIEHAFGIYHVEGGLSEISKAMAKAFKEDGGKMNLKAPVKELLIEDREVKGVILKSGKKVLADEVIINADFSYAMTHLIKPGLLKKYTKDKLLKKTYSCSTYMMYLGVDKIYDIPHHSIVFSNDYKRYINSVSGNKEINEDISLYIRNASVTDSKVAPKGKSNIYILVPVSNNKSGIRWKTKKAFRDEVIRTIKERTELKDIDKHIIAEKIITPNEWESDYNVFLGATFNLGHNISQMLYFRPHNQFEELDNCYLVGGGTHPGSGLPTIYESGRITANLLSKKHGIEFYSENLHIK